MINLLPPKEKRELVLQRSKNLAITIGTVLVISLGALAMILFSVKFYILTEFTKHEYVLHETEKAYQTAEFLSLKDSIEKSNKNVLAVQNFYKNRLSAAKALKVISSIVLPSGLHFTNIKIEQPRTSKAEKVSISGASETRASLLSFKEALEQNQSIKNINFPAENWIKPVDLIFIVTFEYADQK